MAPPISDAAMCLRHPKTRSDSESGSAGQDMQTRRIQDRQLRVSRLAIEFLIHLLDRLLSSIILHLQRTRILGWDRWFKWGHAEHEKVEIARQRVALDDDAAPVLNLASQIGGFLFGGLPVLIDVELTVHQEFELVLGIVDGVGDHIVTDDRLPKSGFG